MPRRRKGRRGGGRTGRTIFTVENPFVLSRENVLEISRKELEIPGDRAFRIISVRGQVTSEQHPSVIQVSLTKYDPEAALKYSRYTATPITLVPLNSVRGMSLRPPTGGQFWHTVKDEIPVILIESPCLAQAQPGGKISGVLRITAELSIDFDDRTCPKSGWSGVPTSSLGGASEYANSRSE